MIPSFLSWLMLGAITTMTPLILGMAQAVTGSLGIEGNMFFDTTNNASPAIYVNDETVPAISLPTTTLQETCMGGSGAQLCYREIKLTGSGGQKGYNAGSMTCTTASCSLIRTTVDCEGAPVADKIYVGWTTSPTTLSGSNLINYEATSSGGEVTARKGSGSNVLVPVGATIKAVFAHVNPGNVKCSLNVMYNKFWTP